MKIRMTKNQNGSPDGVKVIRYIKDKVYDVPAGLGKVFVDDIKCARREVIAPTEERKVEKEVKKEEKKIEKQVKEGNRKK